MPARTNRILEILTERERVEVSALAEELGVSQVTMRKDLTELERRDLIRREHGWAMLRSTDNIEGRLAYHYEEKRTIARRAAELVHDGDTVMIENGSCCALLAAELAARSAFVGEVGIDFGRRGANTEERQVAAFEQIIAAIAANPLPRRVISLHAVQSATAVLDVLKANGILDAGANTICIFHWFSGTSDELARARQHGCRFSINEHMLTTRRGREYARQLPLDRLLLETDAPPGLDAPYSTEALERSLITAAEGIAHVKGIPVQRVIEATSEHAFELLMHEGHVESRHASIMTTIAHPSL